MRIGVPWGHWGLAFFQGTQLLNCVTLGKSPPISGFNSLVYKSDYLSPLRDSEIVDKRKV